jgi:transposase
MGTTAHSNDLRSRVVGEILAGASRREAAERFKVSAASAVRWGSTL